MDLKNKNTEVIKRIIPENGPNYKSAQINKASRRSFQKKHI